MIYQPSEDSILLKNTLIEYLKEIKENSNFNKIRVLDMGSGSGIQAQTALSQGIKKSNILCADINKEAVQYLKNQGLNAIHTNLFNKIKNKSKNSKFDIIIFNAPYLPEDKYDKELDTTAGKKGYEIILEFLEQAKQHLDKKSKIASILLLFSSLSHPKVILKKAKELKYDYKKLAETSLFQERLFVYEFKR